MGRYGHAIVHSRRGQGALGKSSQRIPGCVSALNQAVKQAPKVAIRPKMAIHQSSIRTALVFKRFLVSVGLSPVPSSCHSESRGRPLPNSVLDRLHPADLPPRSSRCKGNQICMTRSMSYKVQKYFTCGTPDDAAAHQCVCTVFLGRRSCERGGRLDNSRSSTHEASDHRDSDLIHYWIKKRRIKHRFVLELMSERA